MPTNLDISPPAAAAKPAARPSNLSPTSAVAQAAGPSKRGERRAQASRGRRRTQIPEARAPPPLQIDPARPETWPPMLRLSDICRDRKRGYPGILPISRAAFLDAIWDGYIPEGLMLGGKVRAWRKEDILAICQHGVTGRRLARRREKEQTAEAAEAAVATPNS